MIFKIVVALFFSFSCSKIITIWFISRSVVNNNSNVITTDENNIEGGAWTNKKGNSIWDNMSENDEY